MALIGGILFNWGGAAGDGFFRYLAFQPSAMLVRPWMAYTAFTSGLVTDPKSFSHALWALVGIYFLGVDLEKRWGGARFVRFLLLSVFAGNVLVLLVSLVPQVPAGLRPALVFGPSAALAALAIAWSRENATRVIRLMFFLPLSGKTFMWITLGYAVMSLIFLQSQPEGAVAPFGAIAVGFALAGSPSPLRTLWLHVKLAGMRRKAGGRLVAKSLLDDTAHGARASLARRPSKVSKSGPSLRVVQGGLDDDKKPKDRRYLN